MMMQQQQPMYGQPQPMMYGQPQPGYYQQPPMQQSRFGGGGMGRMGGGGGGMGMGGAALGAGAGLLGGAMLMNAVSFSPSFRLKKKVAD